MQPRRSRIVKCGGEKSVSARGLVLSPCYGGTSFPSTSASRGMFVSAPEHPTGSMLSIEVQQGRYALLEGLIDRSNNGREAAKVRLRMSVMIVIG